MNIHTFLPPPTHNFEGENEISKTLGRGVENAKTREKGRGNAKVIGGMGFFHFHFLTNSYHGN